MKIAKCFFMLLITTFLVLTMGIISCYADAIDSGVCGSNASWTFDSNGTLTISGSGAMYDYEAYNDMPWYSHIDSIQKVVVKDGITKIGSMSFYNCESLSDVSIADSVETISEGAFDLCTNLKEVTIPTGVKTLGGFTGSGLEEVQIPDSVTKFERQTFAACTNLSKVILPNTISRIEGHVFEGCTSLTNIEIPDSVTEIGFDSFKNCSSLETIKLSNGLKTIEDSAFAGCEGLKSIALPDSIDYIAGQSFAFCYSLKTVSIPPAVTRISDSSFYGCRNLETIYIPAGVIYIGNRAFDQCDSLYEVYFGGTKQQWEEIAIYDYNDKILDAVIHYDSQSSDDEPTIYADDEEIKLSTIFGNYSFEEYIKASNTQNYSPQISYALAGLSRAAYNQTKLDQSLASLGYELNEGENVIHDYIDDQTVAYTIAKKSLTDGSEFVVIAIRGSWGWSWASNANIGTEALLGNGNHAGFEEEANEIFGSLKTLLGDNYINATYVITGHSQGAAAANLLAVKLNENGVSPSTVYDYNFACPNVACLSRGYDWTSGGSYLNIFNIGNAEDPVPLLPSNGIHIWSISGANSLWGKYGQSYWFYPSDDNRSAAGHDMKYYLRALKQLEPITKFYNYDQLSFNMIRRILGVHCPVDVVVYDSSGKAVAGVIDNKELYYDSEFGEVLILIEGDEKWICLPNDQNYKVSLTATGDGSMQYEDHKVNLTSGETVTGKTFDNVQLVEKKEMLSELSSNDTVDDIKLFAVDENDQAIAEIREDGTEIEVNAQEECDHVWNTTYTVDTAATCIKDGSESIHCSICGEIKEGSSRSIPKTTHTYGAWKTTKAATELAAGQQSHKCNVCGKTETKTVAQLAPSLPKVTISSSKAAKKAATVKWKKVSKKNQKKIAKIQIQYSTDKTFKTGVKTVTAKKTAASKKIKKLNSKKTYYFRIRAYKKVNGVVHVSKWSKVKKAKIK